MVESATVNEHLHNVGESKDCLHEYENCEGRWCWPLEHKKCKKCGSMQISAKPKDDLGENKKSLVRPESE